MIIGQKNWIETLTSPRGLEKSSLVMWVMVKAQVDTESHCHDGFV